MRVRRKVNKCECGGLSNLKVTGKEEMCRFCLRGHNKAAEKDHGWWFPAPTNAVGTLSEGPGNVVAMSLAFAFWDVVTDSCPQTELSALSVRDSLQRRVPCSLCS